MCWVVNVTTQPLYTGNDLKTTVGKARWTPRPVWTGAENLPRTSSTTHGQSYFHMPAPGYGRVGALDVFMV